MNNINGIIHDLGSEEIVISGCSTDRADSKKDYCFSNEYHRAIKAIRDILEKD